MTIRDRQHFLLIVAVAGIAFLALQRLIFAPLAASWNHRATAIRQLKQSVAQGSILLDRRAAIRDRWDKMRVHTLPTELSAAEDRVLKSFDRWAQESGVSIGSIRPQWKADEPEYTILECRADASGSLGAVARFLYELEKDPLPLSVDRLEMTSADNNGRTITLTLQVTALLLTQETQP